MKKYTSIPHPDTTTGFSLIEVLAALVIFSLAIITLSYASTESVRNTTHLQAKLLAGIVADNQLILSRHQPATPGIRSGTERQMSHQFTYHIETLSTDQSDFFRLEARIQLLGETRIIVHRTAFHRTYPDS